MSRMGLTPPDRQITLLVTSRLPAYERSADKIRRHEFQGPDSDAGFVEIRLKLPSTFAGFPDPPVKLRKYTTERHQGSNHNFELGELRDGHGRVRGDVRSDQGGQIGR